MVESRELRSIEIDWRRSFRLCSLPFSTRLYSRSESVSVTTQRELMMTERRTKPKARRTSRSSVASKPTARVTKAANTARALGDWRAETLARMRALILEAEPAMIEER